MPVVVKLSVMLYGATQPFCLCGKTELLTVKSIRMAKYLKTKQYSRDNSVKMDYTTFMYVENFVNVRLLSWRYEL